MSSSQTKTKIAASPAQGAGLLAPPKPKMAAPLPPMGNEVHEALDWSGKPPDCPIRTADQVTFISVVRSNDYKFLEPDAGIIKRIDHLPARSPETPREGMFTVRYSIRLLNGTVIAKTPEGPNSVTRFRVPPLRDETPFPRAFYAILPQMKIGETSEFVVNSKWGYGYYGLPMYHKPGDPVPDVPEKRGRIPIDAIRDPKYIFTVTPYVGSPDEMQNGVPPLAPLRISLSLIGVEPLHSSLSPPFTNPIGPVIKDMEELHKQSLKLFNDGFVSIAYAHWDHLRRCAETIFSMTKPIQGFRPGEERLNLTHDEELRLCYVSLLSYSNMLGINISSSTGIKLLKNAKSYIQKSSIEYALSKDKYFGKDETAGLTWRTLQIAAWWWAVHDKKDLSIEGIEQLEKVETVVARSVHRLVEIMCKNDNLSEARKLANCAIEGRSNGAKDHWVAVEPSTRVSLSLPYLRSRPIISRIDATLEKYQRKADEEMEALTAQPDEEMAKALAKGTRKVLEEQGSNVQISAQQKDGE